MSSIDKQNLVCPVNQESSTSTNYENLPNNLNSESTILKMSKSPVDQAGTTSKTDSEQPQQNFNVQEELQCSICTEMFVKAVTLSCSHTFCQYCIKQWQKNKVVCPICRARTTSSCRTLILDSFIERVMYCFAFICSTFYLNNSFRLSKIPARKYKNIDESS